MSRLGQWLAARVDGERLRRALSGAVLYGQLDQRLHVDEAVRQRLAGTVPARSVRQLWCMGGIALLLILNQAFTGVLLLCYYQPGPHVAYTSVRYLMEEVPLGWLIRQMHAWGAHLLVLAVVIHMVKVFLSKAYRPPRELNWMVGTVLFLLTFTFAFTGHLLPWDLFAYWSTTVGTDNVRALPVVGSSLLLYLRGGPGVSDATLARFFVLHTVVLPWVTVLLLLAHFGMVRRQGLSRPL